MNEIVVVGKFLVGKDCRFVEGVVVCVYTIHGMDEGDCDRCT